MILVQANTTYSFLLEIPVGDSTNRYTKPVQLYEVNTKSECRAKSILIYNNISNWNSILQIIKVVCKDFMLKDQWL